MIWLAKLTSPPVAAPAPTKVVADGFIDSYVSWREACEQVSAAYRRWVKCKGAQRDLAFHSYHAALDWEEHAARIHAEWTARVRAHESLTAA